MEVDTLCGSKSAIQCATCAAYRTEIVRCLGCTMRKKGRGAIGMCSLIT